MLVTSSRDTIHAAAAHGEHFVERRLGIEVEHAGRNLVERRVRHPERVKPIGFT